MCCSPSNILFKESTVFESINSWIIGLQKQVTFKKAYQGEEMFR